VDARVQEILSTEDPDLIVDLRYFNHDLSTKYEVFGKNVHIILQNTL